MPLPRKLLRHSQLKQPSVLWWDDAWLVEHPLGPGPRSRYIQFLPCTPTGQSFKLEWLMSIPRFPVLDGRNARNQTHHIFSTTTARRVKQRKWIATQFHAQYSRAWYCANSRMLCTGGRCPNKYARWREYQQQSRFVSCAVIFSLCALRMTGTLPVLMYVKEKWREAHDPSSAKTYFVNIETQETRWELPPPSRWRL